MAGNILIVEDDENVTQLLKYLLEREGHATRVATDGKQARALLEDGEVPDLVLLDIMLPYVDGFHLLAEMRERPAWRDTAVVVLSAKGEERDIVTALDGGADDYIVKPFRPAELMARLRRILNQGVRSHG